jgi:hypothetical protein
MKKYIFLIFLISAVMTIDKQDKDYYYDDDDKNENTTDGSEDIKPVVTVSNNITQITYNVNQILPVNILFNSGSISCSAY